MSEASTGARTAAAETRRKRRRRGTTIVLTSLLAILAILGVIVGTYIGGLKSSYDNNTKTIQNAFPEDKNRPGKSDNKSMNILVLGSDSRAGIENVDKSKAVNGGGKDERSDSMMLVNISGDRKHVTVMSIMRDLWVPIPGHGTNKINAAFAQGGTPLAVQTVEQLLQTRIDHVAELDMASFAAFGDSLNGLDVNVEQRTVASHMKGTVWEAGMNHMNGKEALAFSRERYAYARGDYQRVRNQQALFRAVLNKLVSKDTLSHPSTIKKVVDQVAPYFSRDDSLTFDVLAKLGFSLRDVSPSDIRFATLPTAGVGWSPDGQQSIVNLDEQALPSLQQALKNDTVNDWLSTPNNHEHG